MDAVVAEIVKAFVYATFSYMRTKGLTEEESIALFRAERDRFFKNDPSKLPAPGELPDFEDFSR